jgi:hypothetical protein
MPLTNIALTPRERSYKVADDRGLYIEVTPNGSKLWRYKYRLHGKENRLSMGRFPEVSIAEARRRRDTARLELDAGHDPSLGPGDPVSAPKATRRSRSFRVAITMLPRVGMAAWRLFSALGQISSDQREVS